MNIQQRINQLNWDNLTEAINQNGYACASSILNDAECTELIAQYNLQQAGGIRWVLFFMMRHDITYFIGRYNV